MGKVLKDDGFGNFWIQSDDAGNPQPMVRYVHNVASVLRLVGTAHDICRAEHSRRVDHSGWFLDAFQDETAYGVVAQLPARNGVAQFVPGVQTSLDAANDAGATLYFGDICDDKLDAASRADRLAELYAEKERDYQAAWQAGSYYASLGEEVATMRKQALGLFRELKQARKAFPSNHDAHGLCAVIREKLVSLWEAIQEARQTREALKDGEGGGTPEFSFYAGDARLREAFNEGANL